MIAGLGQGLVLVGLAACAVGFVVGMVGGARASEAAHAIARRLALAFVLAMVLACGVMEYALVFKDFSVAYAAQVGSRSVPLHIAIVSLWSALEGSILFWGLILGVFVAAMALAFRGRHLRHESYALGAAMGVGVFFTFLIASVANPFAPVHPVPADGPGPNPLLQNHLLMIVHPPMLYLGYVGMTAPFAMAVAALLAGRVDAAWMSALRRFSLVVWSFLTLGILLGGWWSYDVLGWGGYWAWDPVENASLLPWLTATAFLHSAMVSERTGRFTGWTVVLALASFLLTLLGTFMTRSGVFNSVHSFTQSPIGPVFLGFIAICLLLSVLLLSARLHLVAADPREPAVGKETAFLLNNLVFTVFTFFVLAGTLFPLLVEAVQGERISVGRPYFDRWAAPLGLALLFLMGVGPALPWGRTTLAQLKARLGVPAAAGLVAAGVGAVAGLRGPWLSGTLAMAGFAATVSLEELAAPARVRVARLGESWPTALWRAARRARRRTGGHVVHLGVVVLALGVAISSSQRREVSLTLSKGQFAPFMQVEVGFVGAETIDEPHRRAEVGRFEVRRNGERVAVLTPRINHYKATGQPIPTPDLLSGPGADLYLSLIRIDDGGAAASVHVIHQPLVAWVWAGGLMMFAGGLVAFWPSRRRRVQAEPVAEAG